MRHEIGKLSGFDGVASIDVIAVVTKESVVCRVALLHLFHTEQECPQFFGL